jgi:hypothetical protein
MRKASLKIDSNSNIVNISAVNLQHKYLPGIRNSSSLQQKGFSFGENIFDDIQGNLSSKTHPFCINHLLTKIFLKYPVKTKWLQVRFTLFIENTSL